MSRRSSIPPHQPSRAAKRRARRGSAWQVQRIDRSDAAVGPDVGVPDLEDVLRAIEGAPRADDWEALRRIVLPVFPRVRAHPADIPAPVTTILPPGVLVGFGADIGPAYLTISEPQLELLGVGKVDLVAQALANLETRAAALDGASITHGAIADVPVAVLQSGAAIGSTLVLAPNQLSRLFGPAPMLFVAPMRDLLIGFPSDVDIDLAAWVFEEIASQDPNCLAPVAYSFDGERLTTARLSGRRRGAAGRLA